MAAPRLAIRAASIRRAQKIISVGQAAVSQRERDGSGSLVILNAESVEAARAIFQNDPWAQKDILVAGEVKEWTIFLDARDRAS